jgi:hypothetical protein
MSRFISPYGILFIAFLVVATAQFILTGVITVLGLQIGAKFAGNNARSMFTSHQIAGFLLLSAALVVPAALAAANNPEFAQTLHAALFEHGCRTPRSLRRPVSVNPFRYRKLKDINAMRRRPPAPRQH